MTDHNDISGTSEGAVYINHQEGLGRVLNNAKLYVKLLNKFKTDTNYDELQETLKGGDYEKAQAQAHTVKGIAANLSLPELFKQSLELETQIKARAVNPESVESFKVCFKETLAAVDKVIAQYGG
ncbi:MAG: Hpt domain-containing protein [Treponema sp.]|jgi:HPt (histidine-containing phosphotransfer) domain-containing protein|nr:Hpt domain-containing protein [Treponema sp.]